MTLIYILCTYINMSTLSEYAVLAHTKVVNTAGETIILGGDVGSYPGTTITGLCADPDPPCLGRIVLYGEIHAGDADAALAQAELALEYAKITAEPVDATLPTELGGTTVFPGTYDFEGPNVTLNGELILDAGNDPDAEFIFKIAGTLTTGQNSSVSVFFPTEPICPIFWQVGDSVTLGFRSGFVGRILAQNSITLSENASVTQPGNLWSINGSVILNTNLIDNIFCVPDSFFPIPVINNITAVPNPESGTILIVTGSGLLFPRSITINGQEARADQIIRDSDNQLRLRISPDITGIVIVVVTTRGGSATGQVNVPVQDLVFISCISPHKGSIHGGTIVSVFGSGFTGTTSVSFNDTPALSFFQNSDNQITAVSPVHVAGKVLITVTTPLDSASFPFKFVRKCDKIVCDDTLDQNKPKHDKGDKGDKNPKSDKCDKELNHDKCDKKFEHDKLPVSNKFKQTKKCGRCNGFL